MDKDLLSSANILASIDTTMSRRQAINTTFSTGPPVLKARGNFILALLKG